VTPVTVLPTTGQSLPSSPGSITVPSSAKRARPARIAAHEAWAPKPAGVTIPIAVMAALVGACMGGPVRGREFNRGIAGIVDPAVDPRRAPVDEAHLVLIGVDDDGIEVHLEPLLRFASELPFPLRMGRGDREAERAPMGCALHLHRLAAPEEPAHLLIGRRGVEMAEVEVGGETRGARRSPGLIEGAGELLPGRPVGREGAAAGAGRGRGGAARGARGAGGWGDGGARGGGGGGDRGRAARGGGGRRALAGARQGES